jgi:hypothetical protein
VHIFREAVAGSERPAPSVGWPERRRSSRVYPLVVARVVELADTGGLNPPGSKEPCGFKSRPGHSAE